VEITIKKETIEVEVKPPPVAPPLPAEL